MPELDGTSIVAIASFFALVATWLIAPTSAPVAAREPFPAAATAA